MTMEDQLLEPSFYNPLWEMGQCTPPQTNKTKEKDAHTRCKGMQARERGKLSASESAHATCNPSPTDRPSAPSANRTHPTRGLLSPPGLPSDDHLHHATTTIHASPLPRMMITHYTATNPPLHSPLPPTPQPTAASPRPKSAVDLSRTQMLHLAQSRHLAHMAG